MGSMSNLFRMFKFISSIIFGTEVPKEQNNAKMLTKVDKTEVQSPPPALYTPIDDPGPTRWAVADHPRTKEVTSELDEFFLKHWPWENEKAKARFAVSETNRWACISLPLVADDRIYDLARLNTTLFLLDGELARLEVRGWVQS